MLKAIARRLKRKSSAEKKVETQLNVAPLSVSPKVSENTAPPSPSKMSKEDFDASKTILAIYLGVDVEKERYLIKICEEALTNMPPGWLWRAAEGDYKGVPFYYNYLTESSQWNHPEEEFLRKRISDQRLKYNEKRRQLREEKAKAVKAKKETEEKERIKAQKRESELCRLKLEKKILVDQLVGELAGTTEEADELKDKMVSVVLLVADSLGINLKSEQDLIFIGDEGVYL